MPGLSYYIWFQEFGSKNCIQPKIDPYPQEYRKYAWEQGSLAVCMYVHMEKDLKDPDLKTVQYPTTPDPDL